MDHLISVIIPCYNSAQYISHAIDAMLCQTYKNIEIIIVDDNSTDNLTGVVDFYLQKYNFIRYFRLPQDDSFRFDKCGNKINAGWMARNYGVEMARGELITFQDADDGSCSNRIEFQYDIMKKYNSHHVNVDWQQYKDDNNCKYLEFKLSNNDIIATQEILDLAKRNKRGFLKYLFGKNEDSNPVEFFLRRLNRKFVGEYQSYPCAASMPLLKKEVFKKCRFRPLWERTRPSLRGRGADQDFNFWVAETFQDSLAVKVPLILWRVKNDNQAYMGKEHKFINSI